jgi:antitoxin (DNA-binding transcriptional repressor) of toxin-antitoxin stability system
MQVPISEARTKLPHLIKQLQRNPNVTYEITVHREVVAELKAPLQLPVGGEAAKRLLAILEQKPQSRSRKKVRVSENIKKHLYDKPHGTRA